MRGQGKDGHLLAKEGGLRGSQPRQHWSQTSSPQNLEKVGSAVEALAGEHGEHTSHGREGADRPGPMRVQRWAPGKDAGLSWWCELVV